MLAKLFQSHSHIFWAGLAMFTCLDKDFCPIVLSRILYSGRQWVCKDNFMQGKLVKNPTNSTILRAVGRF